MVWRRIALPSLSGNDVFPVSTQSQINEERTRNVRSTALLPLTIIKIARPVDSAPSRGTPYRPTPRVSVEDSVAERMHSLTFPFGPLSSSLGGRLPLNFAG